MDGEGVSIGPVREEEREGSWRGYPIVLFCGKGGFPWSCIGEGVVPVGVTLVLCGGYPGSVQGTPSPAPTVLSKGVGTPGLVKGNLFLLPL